MPALEVRPLQIHDLPALMAVQRAAYGDGFMESTEVFARRLASPVNCSLALLLDGVFDVWLLVSNAATGVPSSPPREMGRLSPDRVKPVHGYARPR